MEEQLTNIQSNNIKTYIAACKQTLTEEYSFFFHSQASVLNTVPPHFLKQRKLECPFLYLKTTERLIFKSTE